MAEDQTFSWLLYMKKQWDFFVLVVKRKKKIFAHTDMSPERLIKQKHSCMNRSDTMLRTLGNGRLLLCGMALECTRVQNTCWCLANHIQSPYKTGIFEKTSNSTPFTNE